MSILFLVSLFGVVVCIFLWFRDIRIWVRTGCSGYRKAAIHGIFQTTLATTGAGIVWFWPDASILGTGITWLAIYLQGKEIKEKIWTNEPAITRFLGSAPLNRKKR